MAAIRRLLTVLQAAIVVSAIWFVPTGCEPQEKQPPKVDKSSATSQPAKGTQPAETEHPKKSEHPEHPK